MSLGGRTAIVGIAERKPTLSTDGETILGMLAEITMQAIADAGLEPGDVDGLVTGNFADLPEEAPATLVEHLGLDVSFAEIVDLGGATGVAMAIRAAAAIEAGLCETVVCHTGSRMREGAAPELPAAAGLEADRAPAARLEAPFTTMDTNIGYAMVAQRYQSEYGLTPEQRAKIAVAQRYNACHNEEALFYGTPISVDDVLGSPLVADPLRILEIGVSCAGAAAIVVTTAKRAKRMQHPPAYILGAGERVAHGSVAAAETLNDTPLKDSADRAFKMAGIRRGDIDLASLSDHCTVSVLLSLEEAGFAKKGQGGGFVDAHDLRWDGDFPVNSHGGQLSFGQPGLAGGMSHLTEASRQVMGRAEQRQIPGCEFAFVNGTGGVMSQQASLILGRDRQ